MNYTIKSVPSDPYLHKQSHNYGLPDQWVPTNRCQQDKQIPAPESIQPSLGEINKPWESVSHL